MKTSIYTSVSARALMIGMPAVAQTNTSTVDQTGAAAAATVNQTGSNNNSDIDQNGNGLTFTSGPNSGRSVVADVEQTGSNGVSKITQQGGRASATLVQGGTG